MSTCDPYRRMPAYGPHSADFPVPDVLNECPFLSDRKNGVGEVRDHAPTFRSSWPASAVDRAFYALERLRAERTAAAIDRLDDTVRLLKRLGLDVTIEEEWGQSAIDPTCP